jgi:hypothetical protein
MMFGLCILKGSFEATGACLRPLCGENIGWSEQRQSRNAPDQLTESLSMTPVARAWGLRSAEHAPWSSSAPIRFPELNLDSMPTFC